MKKYLALILALVFVLALCTGCGAKTEEPAAEEAPVVEAEPAPEAAPAEGPTWADYQEYLIEQAGANAPDLEEFKGQVYAIASWEDLDQTVSPWDQMFTTIGLSTWEEFQAGIVKEAAVMGSSADMASGEATAEPAAETTEEASGEASGEAPANDGGAALAGTSTNGAHGGNGDTSEAAYTEYLKAWILAEDEVNESMTADVVEGEFIPAIEAGTFDAFPADMLFNGMLVTGSAMTYDQFVAAGGVY